jgi:uncharacterized protein YceH (UPF0502 family)
MLMRQAGGSDDHFNRRTPELHERVEALEREVADLRRRMTLDDADLNRLAGGERPN